MQADLSRCVPQDISNALWAFATMRHNCGDMLLNGCAAVSARIMARFKPQEIANTLWCALMWLPAWRELALACALTLLYSHV